MTESLTNNSPIELRRLELQMQMAEESAKLGLWHCELARDRIVWLGEPGVLDATEAPRTFTLGDFLKLLMPQERAHVRAALEECRRNGRPFGLVTRIGAGSTERVVELWGRGLSEPGEVEPREIVGVFRDITGELRIHEEAAALRYDLGERVKELTLLHDTARILKENARPLEEIMEQVVERVALAMRYPEATMARLSCGEHHSATPGFHSTRWGLEADFVTGDGTNGKVEVFYKEPKPDGDEGPFLREERYLVESLAEMLEAFLSSRRMSTALEHSRQQLAHAIQGAGIGLWDWDLASGRVKLDRRAAEMLEHPPEREECEIEELLSRFHEEDRAAVRERLRSHMDGETSHFEVEARVVTGKALRWVLARGQRVECSGEAAKRVVGIYLDVTERKKSEELEQQLSRVQRMEAVGRLAGGVAHDFNNILTVINGYSELLLSQPTIEGDLRYDLEEIHQASTRGANLTRQLLAFSRMQVLRPEVLELDKVVGSLEKMLRRLIGEDIEFVVLRAENLWPVKADRGQVEQILMNLVVNARDAMPGGGRLTIEVSNTELDENFAKEHVGASPGHHVQLRVTDTGSGMDEEIKNKLFEPFFTTKESDKGTGLGLSTVYGIVKQSGGSIFVDSEIGKGSSFDIYLPRCEESPWEEDARPAVRTAVTDDGRTILLVEDDEHLRPLLRRVLTHHGWKVLDARNGAEALVLVERRGAEIDLLLTDVVMSYINGVELARRARGYWPELSIVYMTGYLDRRIELDLPEDARVLSKPFTPAFLVETLRETFRGDSHGS